MGFNSGFKVLIMWGGLHYLPNIDGKLVANSKGCSSVQGATSFETIKSDQGKRQSIAKKKIYIYI